MNMPKQSLVQNNPHNQRSNIQRLVQQSIDMTNELLALCDQNVDDGRFMLSMSKDFPKLKRMGRCDLIIPLQESLTASLPPTPETESKHYPFPLDTPTFQGGVTRQIISRRLRSFRIHGRDRSHEITCKTEKDYDSRQQRPDIHVSRKT
jgi:hypothetical protein